VCWPTEPDDDDSPFLTTDEGKGVSELVGRKRRVGNALGLYVMVKNLEEQRSSADGNKRRVPGPVKVEKKRRDMQWKRHGPSGALNRPVPSITAPNHFDGHLPRPQELEHRANDVELTIVEETPRLGSRRGGYGANTVTSENGRQSQGWIVNREEDDTERRLPPPGRVTRQHDVHTSSQVEGLRVVCGGGIVDAVRRNGRVGTSTQASRSG
jgi:hypothetical protein